MPSYFDTATPIFKALTAEELGMVSDKYRAMEDAIALETNKDRFTIKEAIDGLPEGDPYRAKLEAQVKKIDDSLASLKNNGFSWQYKDDMDDIRKTYQDESGPIIKAYTSMKNDIDFINKAKITNPTSIIVTPPGGIEDYINGKQYTPHIIDGFSLEKKAREVFGALKNRYLYENGYNVEEVLNGLFVKISNRNGLSEEAFEQLLTSEDPTGVAANIYNGVKNEIMKQFGITPEKYAMMPKSERDKISSTVRLSMSSAIGPESSTMMANPLAKGLNTGTGTGANISYASGMNRAIDEGVDIFMNVKEFDYADVFKYIDQFSGNGGFSDANSDMTNYITSKVPGDFSGTLDGDRLKKIWIPKPEKGRERLLNKLSNRLKNFAESDIGKSIEFKFEMDPAEKKIGIWYNRGKFDAYVDEMAIKNKEFNFTSNGQKPLRTYIFDRIAQTDKVDKFSSIYELDENGNVSRNSISSKYNGKDKDLVKVKNDILSDDSRIGYTPLYGGRLFITGASQRRYVIDTTRLSKEIQDIIKKVYSYQTDKNARKKLVEEYNNIADANGYPKDQTDYYKMNVMIKRELTVLSTGALGAFQYPSDRGSGDSKAPSTSMSNVNNQQ